MEKMYLLIIVSLYTIHIYNTILLLHFTISSGVCYRTLGRAHDAEHQFKLALALNPAYYSAVFNLGLTYQHLNRWDEAIDHFRRVTQVSAWNFVVACKNNFISL